MNSKRKKTPIAFEYVEMERENNLGAWMVLEIRIFYVKYTIVSFIMPVLEISL